MVFQMMPLASMQRGCSCARLLSPDTSCSGCRVGLPERTPDGVETLVITSSSTDWQILSQQRFVVRALQLA